MKLSGLMVGLIVGGALGVVGTAFCIGPIRQAVLHNNHHPSQSLLEAGGSDRYEDYVMCTGAASANAKTLTDGVWLLDYRGGKLLATVIDRNTGKITAWADLDLPTEFGIPPKQNVHFMMSTGTIAQGQAALYVAETNSGKFGVYTMGADATGSGLAIRRHDLTTFRKKS